MASPRTLDLYKSLILPRLADGPKSQLQLDIPRYALDALRGEGLVQMQTHAYRTSAGRGAIQMWCLAGYQEPRLRDCATMTFERLEAPA